MLRSKAQVIVVCLLVLPLSTAFSAIVMIDDFNDGSAGMTIESDSASSASGRNGFVATGVIGQRRASKLVVGTGPDSIRLRINYLDSGVLAFSQGYDTAGDIIVGYGYDHIFYGDNSLNVDLTSGGANSHLVLSFLTADVASQLSVELTTRDNWGSSTWTGPTPSGVFSTPTAMMIPLFGSDWVDSSTHGSADRTAIDHIKITLHGVANGDYAIDEIYTDVPEPATLSLMLAAGLPALLKRKRSAR